MHALTLVHEERCSPWKQSNESKEEGGTGEQEQEKGEGETGGGKNRRKEGEGGGLRERFEEGGEGEGGTSGVQFNCIPLWVLPGNHTQHAHAVHMLLPAPTAEPEIWCCPHRPPHISSIAYGRPTVLGYPMALYPLAALRTAPSSG